MTFNPQIPQPANIIANSQAQLLVNNQQLNLVYGTSGDHYAWDNATGGEQNLHAKVTLPGLPTANAPGNVLPTPAAGIGAAFSITTAGITRPFWRRDGNAGVSEYSLLPIRAFGSFTGGAVTISAMNLSAVRSSVGVFRLTLTANAVSGDTYCVLVGVGIDALNVNRAGMYNIINATTVDVAFRNADGNILADPNSFTVAILQF